MNIFDNLLVLQAPNIRELMDELARYLSTGRDLHVKDGLLWWFERKHIYPTLYRMAMDYLSIPGTLFVLIFIMMAILIYLTYY